MVRARFFQSDVTYVADIGRWLSVTSATATLIGLSFFNALHGPAYDCVRAGAHLLRSRRGAFVPLMQIESAAGQATSIVRMIPVLSSPLKENFYVRD